MSYPRGKHTFFVVSPEVDHNYYYYDEPPEWYPCIAEVKATSQREAKKLAYRDPEMKQWIDEARGDGKNPFAEMKVVHPSCAHEPCVCSYNDMICPICYREFFSD